MSVDFDVRDNRGRKCYYGLWTRILTRHDGLKLKHLMMDLFLTNTSQGVNWWTGVVWITVINTSGLILTAPIHCRASIGEQVMYCYISPNLFWWRNKLIYILDGLRVSNFQQIFIFEWTIILIIQWFSKDSIYFIMKGVIKYWHLM